MLQQYSLGYFLFIIALILLPFNGLPLTILGEGSKEGALYPLIILVFIFIFQNSIIRINSNIYIQRILFKFIIFVLFFFIYIFFVYFFNYEVISNVYYMERTGNIRFFQQITQLGLGFLILFSISFYLNSEQKMFSMVKALRYIIIFYILFSLFQFIAYTFNGFTLTIYRIIGNYIYPEGLVEFALERRHALHSVSQEPSFLSMYLSFVSPFAIAYALLKKRFLILFLITLIILMSLSRTGYVIYSFQVFLLFFLFKYKYFTLKKFLTYILLLIPILVVVSLTPFIDTLLSLFDIENNGSNAARYAGAYSAIEVWLHNNIFFGVGLGQTGFHSIQYLPSWGFLSGDVYDTVNGLRWPPIHNLLIRVLVEIGLIGFIFWVGMFIYFLKKVHFIIYIKYKYLGYIDWLGYAIFVSLIGVFLSMFNRELFTNMIIWIVLGIALSYIKINIKSKEIKNATKKNT